MTEQSEMDGGVGVRREAEAPRSAALPSVRGWGFWWTVAVALTVALAYGEEVSARREFEVASIKPSPPASRGYDLITDQMHESLPFDGVPLDASLKRVTLRRFSLISIIAMAYGVRARDVSAPSWTSEKRFDVDAVLPPGAPGSLADEMMQSLLRERFALRLHQEKRQKAVYALIVGKDGPKLRPSTRPNGASAAEPRIPPAISGVPDRSLPEAAIRQAPWFSLSGAAMDDLARALSRLVGERVINMTKLEGRYDVSIAGFGRALGQDDGTGPSVFDAVNDLGLRLERRTAEVNVLVIDSVAKEPTAN